MGRYSVCLCPIKRTSGLYGLNRIFYSVDFFTMWHSFIVCLFDLLPYVHDKTADVMSGRSVFLTTLFLGKPPRSSLPVLIINSSAINCKLVLISGRGRMAIVIFSMKY